MIDYQILTAWIFALSVAFDFSKQVVYSAWKEISRGRKIGTVSASIGMPFQKFFSLSNKIFIVFILVLLNFIVAGFDDFLSLFLLLSWERLILFNNEVLASSLAESKA